MLDYADIIALNKSDKRGALDALRDSKKQYQRNNMLFDVDVDELPVYGTVASQFNDPGVNNLYTNLLKIVEEKTGFEFVSENNSISHTPDKIYIIPPKRVRYLSEIAETIRKYNGWVKSQSKVAQKLFSLNQSIDLVKDSGKENNVVSLQEIYNSTLKELDPYNKEILDNWETKKRSYEGDYYIFKVRDKEIKIATTTQSLSHLKIPKVSLPKYESWGEILNWVLSENVPGEFPFAAGVFPFKREGEDPTRMFAGEGGPERTNRRFHYVSRGA